LSGALTVSSTSVTTPATVALSGIGGLAGALQIQPAQVSFPTTGVGITSSPVTVTLTNVGTISPFENVTLTVSSQFAVASSTCGSSIAAGASCAASLTFTPANSGAQSGTLTIAASGLNASAVVPLSGSGFDFTPAISGAAAQSVASGQTATYALTLTSSGSGTNSFTFQCNSLPEYAACVFNPSTLTVASGSTGTETVQINTSQASAALRRPEWKAGAWPLSLGCLLFLVPLAKRRRAWLVVLLVTGLCVAGLTSCTGAGGGGGGTPPSPSSTTQNTPAGTYSIPVVISSNGVNHTVTLSLQVD
jgi:hypothetical protein